MKYQRDSLAGDRTRPWSIGGWELQVQQKKQEIRTLVMVNHLERVSLAADTLSQLPPGSGKAEDLQLLILRSALTELERESAAGGLDVPVPIPSLLEGLHRAERYAASHGDPELAGKASLVSQRLSSGA